MTAFITSAACISPQKTTDSVGFPIDFVPFSSNLLHCIEPNYRDYINPLQLRRMSKVLKMGLGASMICLKKINMENPDAIIVGTGLGCGEDLEKFLTSFIDSNEQVLSPTPFIQSTHNMVAAQIAVMLKNHNYNMTYCHRGFSFEEALIDALMLIKDGQASNVLVGGIDEITRNNFKFYDYLNYWKKEIDFDKKLFEQNSPGTIAGEGAVFFTLNADRTPDASGLEDVFLFYKPLNNQEIEENISVFLKRNGLTKENVDLVVLGMNGDCHFDEVYHYLINNYFSAETMLTYYKHLCGEYMTSTSFALWLADNILKSQAIPDYFKITQAESKTVNNILIYNHYRNSNHSLMLISRK